MTKKREDAFAKEMIEYSKGHWTLEKPNLPGVYAVANETPDYKINETILFLDYRSIKYLKNNNGDYYWSKPIPKYPDVPKEKKMCTEEEMRINEIVDHIDEFGDWIDMAYQLKVPEEIEEEEEIKTWLLERFPIQILFKTFLGNWLEPIEDLYKGLSPSTIEFLRFKI